MWSRFFGRLFRKVLIVVSSSQSCRGEEEEGREEGGGGEGWGGSGKSVVERPRGCRGLFWLYRKLLWAVICKEGLDDMSSLSFYFYHLEHHSKNP